MLRLNIMAAAGLALIAAAAAPAASAEPKAGQPKEKKICRTVQMSGRITPQKICRKVERPAAEEESPRNPRAPNEPANRND